MTSRTVISALILALGASSALAEKTAAPAQPAPQVFITSKFIETLDEFDSKHQILTDPQYQVYLRAFSQKKDVDIFTAPSVLTRSGQNAKIEVIKEVVYPAGSNEGKPRFETINTGVTLEVQPVIVGDKIQVYGKATIREPDAPESAAKSNLRGKQRDLKALSFNTTETVFSSKVKDGETIFLVCRRSDKQKGRLLIAVTIKLIDPAGMPVSKGSTGTAQANGPLDNSTPLNVSAYTLTGTPKELLPILTPAPVEPVVPPARNDTEKNSAWSWLRAQPSSEPAATPLPLGVPTITGVFTDPQFTTIRSAIEKDSKHFLKKLDSKQVVSAEKILLKAGDYETGLTPVVGPDGYTIDLDLTPRIVAAHAGTAASPSLTTRATNTAVTIWDGQWVALSFAPGPGNRPAQTFFIQVQGQKS